METQAPMSYSRLMEVIFFMAVVNQMIFLVAPTAQLAPSLKEVPAMIGCLAGSETIRSSGLTETTNSVEVWEWI
jgi:hypothetical protein